MTELSKPRKQYRDLRSARWMAPDDFRSFGHRSRTMQMGYAPEDWEGKPIVAILNTWSDAQPCHLHFKHRVEDIKRRSEEHTSELQSLMRISYAVFCLKKKNKITNKN